MEEEKGLKKKKDWEKMEVAQAGTADQVTSIRLLTGAMEVNNVIGHALEETPSRIKEFKLLPPCDGLKSLNKTSLFCKELCKELCCTQHILVQFNGLKKYNKY